MHIVASSNAGVPHPNLVTSLSPEFKESIIQALSEEVKCAAIGEDYEPRRKAFININAVIFKDFLVICTTEGNPVVGEVGEAHEYRAVEYSALEYYRTTRSCKGILSIRDYLTDFPEIVAQSGYALRYAVEQD